MPVGGRPDLAHHVAQRTLHLTQDSQQLSEFVLAIGFERVRQIVVRNQAGGAHGLVDRSDDRARDREGRTDAHGQARNREDQHRQLGHLHVVSHFLRALLGECVLVLLQVAHRGEVSLDAGQQLLFEQRIHGGLVARLQVLRQLGARFEVSDASLADHAKERLPFFGDDARFELLLNFADLGAGLLDERREIVVHVRQARGLGHGDHPACVELRLLYPSLDEIGPMLVFARRLDVGLRLNKPPKGHCDDRQQHREDQAEAQHQSCPDLEVVQVHGVSSVPDRFVP